MRNTAADAVSGKGSKTEARPGVSFFGQAFVLEPLFAAVLRPASMPRALHHACLPLLASCIPPWSDTTGHDYSSGHVVEQYHRLRPLSQPGSSPSISYPMRPRQHTGRCCSVCARCLS